METRSYRVRRVIADLDESEHIEIRTGKRTTMVVTGMTVEVSEDIPTLGTLISITARAHCKERPRYVPEWPISVTRCYEILVPLVEKLREAR